MVRKRDRLLTALREAASGVGEERSCQLEREALHRLRSRGDGRRLAA